MGAPDPVPAPSRHEALDRFRGLALVAMLVHHLIGWLIGRDARAVLPGWHGFAVTDVAAPAFFVTAGMSAALLVRSRRRKGMPAPQIAGQVLRRYGLLVPLGIGLRLALGWSPDGFGVLEALGVAVVAATALATVLPDHVELTAAAVTLGVGMLVERAVVANHDWVSVELVGGKFPVITYVGFALVGVAVVDGGRHRDRAWVASAALLTSAATILLVVRGMTPDRYPGDLRFVVPGLAGTAIAYALTQLDWPALLAPLDLLLRRAAAHTLGIFLAHYALYGALEQIGVTGSVPEMAAVAIAVAVMLALCLAAPLVPPLPWSPRTGRVGDGGPVVTSSTIATTISTSTNSERVAL